MQKLPPYLGTVLVVASVAALKTVLNRVLGIDSPLLLFFTGITFCAWWGGLRQGLFAYVLSTAAIFALFLTPREASDSVMRIRLAFFTLDSFVVIFLCSRLHRSYHQLRKVYRAMAMSEKSLRKIFESNMIGLIFSDFDGRVIEANDYFLTLLKAKREDLETGKLNWKDFTPAEYLDQSLNGLEEVRESGRVVPFEIQYFRTDGERVTVLVGGSRVEENRVVAFILDISDRKEAQDSLAALNNRLEESVRERTLQLTDMNQELTKLVRESILAEEKLRQSETFLDSIVEHIPNMVFVKRASDLRFVRFNKTGEDLLGYSQEQLIGKNDYDFFPKEQADGYTRKDRQVLAQKTVVDIGEEAIETRIGTRILHTRKIPILDKDGQPAYLLGISEDITDRKAVEKQRTELLHEQSARWEAEKSAARLKFLSDASAALNTGLDLSVMVSGFLAVVTENFAHVCSVDLLEDDRKRLWRLSRQAGSGPGMEEAHYPSVEDGTVASVLRTSSAFVSEARLVLPLSNREGSFGCLTLEAPHGHTYNTLDVSMAHDLARRAESAIDNAQLYGKAQEASRTKSAFMANMSHEIRTPLGAMLGFAELALDDTELSPLQANHLTTILRNGQQLLRIVDEVLDLSKVESDRIEIEQLVMPLPKLLSEVSMLFSLKAEEKGLQFTVGPKGRLPETIKTDPLRLRQIMLNVVGNAIKFTEKGSVSMTVEYLPSGTPSQGVLEILVTDTGIGISPEQAKKLFQPFVQADQTMTRKFGGTGLGLFLSRKLASLLGGDVVLNRSEAGKGSQFRVTIPLEVVDHTLLSGGDFTSSGKIQWANSLPESGQVLVVDDALENRQLVHAFLGRMGVKTEQATNGKEGVEKALAGEFDVVLMDIQMPVMDGFEAVKRLRDSGYNKTIVALTAHAMKGDREKCLSNGFDDYLCKPLGRDALTECLMQHMQHKLEGKA